MLNLIKLYKTYILNSSFIRSISYISGGSMIAQIVPFLVLPVLQKYFYGPFEFGVFTFYLVFSELLISVSTLKYEYAIVAERRFKNSINLLILSVFNVMVIAFLSLILIIILNVFYPKSELIVTLGNLIYLVPLSILFYGIFESFNYWFNREQKFNLLGLNKIFVSTGSEATKLLAGAKMLSFGLIVGRVTGQLVGLIFNFYHFIRSDIRLLRLFSYRQMINLAVKHKEFALFTTPAVLLGALVNYSYVNLFLIYYGEQVVGLMGVSISYVGAAFTLISVSFAQVFYRKIADIESTEFLKKLYLKFCVVLTIPSFAIVLFIYLIPEDIIISLLGERWTGMIFIVRTIVLWLSVSFISSSLSFIYIKLRRQKEMMFFNIIHLMLITGSIYFSHIYFGDFIHTLQIFTAAQIFYYLISLTTAIFFLNNPKKII